MNKLIRTTGFVLGATGAAMMAYGMMVEAHRLVVERHTLRLPGWPERLRGYRIAVLADLHVYTEASASLARQAVTMALEEAPDMVVLPGDIIDRWTTKTPWVVGAILEPLLIMEGSVVAVPGNHEYKWGDATEMGRILSELNIRFLRNENWRHHGITWVGIDSANEEMANPCAAMEGADLNPAIALWHEPDMVRWLPKGCALQISGHSHGGQFLIAGWAPKTSRNGRKYLRGFYPKAPTPLYVSRGVGTTFLPSRYQCPPEVSVLTLVPA